MDTKSHAGGATNALGASGTRYAPTITWGTTASHIPLSSSASPSLSCPRQLQVQVEVEAEAEAETEATAPPRYKDH